MKAGGTRSGRAAAGGLRLRHFVPLAGFVVPTMAIGFGHVIPRSCIAGWNELTLGFAATIAGACAAHASGVRLAVRDPGGRDGEA
jgi:hypothetical protein